MLVRAVRAGVVCAEDAEVVGATRIGHVDLAELARALGVSYKTLQKRRSRAESALTKWLTGEGYSSFEFVEKRADTPLFL